MTPDRMDAAWQRFLAAERGPLRRYGVALALALASLVLVQLLQSVERAHFSSLALTSVVLSAIYGGRGPAMLDTLVTAIGVDYMLSAPGSVAFESWTSVIHIVVHALVGLLIAEIVARLRDAYRELDAKHAEAVLASRARERVLAIVSHDLRSPLAAVLMAAECLKHAPEREAGILADRILRSGHQMRRMIGDLLDAVKIEKGRFRVELRPNDLREVLEDALQGVRADAEARDVLLQVSVPDAVAPAVCDRGRMAQVFSNLLSNAVKFSPRGAPVEVELRLEGSLAQLRVRDHGAGVAPEEVPRLFQRDWQSRATAHQGTGLGLFISKAIVDAHDGRIAYRAEGGEGATFTVTIPAERAPKVL